MVTTVGDGSSGAQNVTQMWQKLLKRADRNGDGQVSLDELKTTMQSSDAQRTAALEEFFKKWDSDADGSVTESEFTKAVQAMESHGRPHGPPPSPEAMFKSTDTDGDGKINKDDLKTAMSQHGTVSDNKVDDLFGKLDADQDGSVTEAEFVKGMKTIHQERHADRAEAGPETSDSKIQKLIEQLSRTESYEADGTTKQTLLQSLFSVTV